MSLKTLTGAGARGQGGDRAAEGMGCAQAVDARVAADVLVAQDVELVRLRDEVEAAGVGVDVLERHPDRARVVLQRRVPVRLVLSVGLSVGSYVSH